MHSHIYRYFHTRSSCGEGLLPRELPDVRVRVYALEVEVCVTLCAQRSRSYISYRYLRVESHNRESLSTLKYLYHIYLIIYEYI